MERLGAALVAGAVAAVLAAPAAHAATGPALNVNSGADRHAINPDIYGLNYADPALANALNLPVDRWGGNTTDTYNWQVHSSNTGNDYFFENLSDCWDASHSYCANGDFNGYQAFIAKDRAAGTKTLLTLPMMGLVAKDAPRDHPFSCGFPRTALPNQNAFDPYDTNCGNGVNGGSQLPSDPARTGTPINASFSAAWIADLKSRYGAAAAGGVGLYELGNEPALWSDTHRDMHPAKETYDELGDKSVALATAVKNADAGAQVLGFSEWGWPNYFCSGADNVSQGCFASSPDRAQHGGTPMVEWFLQRMRDAGQTQGRRLLDYLDLHYYRQGGDTTDVTRSLWDPSYTDPSWINDQIMLLPRMKQWVADNYPGTKLALSEYNLSEGGNTIGNVLIQADVLGIFAREGVDLATRWAMPDDGNSRIDDAFRIFRAYDGGQARFGDTWVRSTSGDQGQLAVYGAQRAADGAYTVLVINKSGGALTSPLNLTGISASGPAQRWEWTGNGIARGIDQAVDPDGFDATYPAQSLTLFVIPTTSSPPPPPPPPPTTTETTTTGPTTTGTTTTAPTTTGTTTTSTSTTTTSTSTTTTPLPPGTTTSTFTTTEPTPPAGVPGARTGGEATAEAAPGSGAGATTASEAAPQLVPLIPPVAVKVGTVKAAASGAITVAANVGGPGTLSAVATATVPASRTKARRAAKRTRTIAYGSASGTATRAGTARATIKPSRAVAKLLKAGRTLPVTVSIAFAPRDGAPPAPQTKSLRVRRPGKR